MPLRKIKRALVRIISLNARCSAFSIQPNRTGLPLESSSPLFRNDEFEYDVLIIGAFSGAATALMLKRKRPDGYAGEQRNPFISRPLSWQ
jgi:hypothetical protein